jgi:hypothetical protein
MGLFHTVDKAATAWRWPLNAWGFTLASHVFLDDMVLRHRGMSPFKFTADIVNEVKLQVLTAASMKMTCLLRCWPTFQRFLRPASPGRLIALIGRLDDGGSKNLWNIRKFCETSRCNNNFVNEVRCISEAYISDAYLLSSNNCFNSYRTQDDLCCRYSFWRPGLFCHPLKQTGMGRGGERTFILAFFSSHLKIKRHRERRV